jgi:putative heme-binding domain-containing protein
MNPFFARWICLLVILKSINASAEAPPAVTNPPPIQMLVPGFTVRELPLQLNNINNLVYAPDGRLFALCYDGNVLQLKDTDGDGLEDTATHFYDNAKGEIHESIGAAWGPGGLYIASRGRVIRIEDKGDGTGEVETVTSGWVPPTGAAGSSLDAVGLAVDKSGNIFFGLGCDDWMAAYRVNKDTGKSDYSVHSDRGTIQKLSADWKHREAICTGLRFTVSLAFNAAGDLFCTDQEGATWLPNGNPLDELLQIQPGRHYGFPPRHPKYLPDVIDEPSVFDYAPQHQSTCGLHFNEPVGGGDKIFGPAWWRGDAIIAGESRGKIWRTKLVKTATGYVAQNNLIACLTMLTIDAVPTPQGDLLVTCHSGPPDWGTGPTGKGKFYKISYADKSVSQPVFAYAASPTETRVVFDRPLEPTQWKILVSQSAVTMGKYVTAGDRYESFRPSYAVVSNQLTFPRTEMKVLSAGVASNGCELVLWTAPRVQAVNYAVKLPEPARTERTHDESKHELRQAAGIDMLSDLTGVEAEWRAARGKQSWTGWLPHLDLNVSQGFTMASPEHRELFRMMKLPGTVKLRTQLDLWLMLHPVTQPGAKLDYEYPPETVTLIFKSDHPLKLDARTRVDRINNSESRITVQPKQNDFLPLELTVETGGSAPQLNVSFFTDEDPRPRSMFLRRFLMPFAKPYGVEMPFVTRQFPEIAGGDWTRGKGVFFSEKAACSKCHTVAGEGGKIGPDLSNLTQRDYESVMKDIAQPSAAINPDHIAYIVELKNGEMVNGVILSDTPEQIVLGQATGKDLVVPRSNIASMRASSVSLMPEGLLKGLSSQQQRDLLTFLLMPPPEAKKN